MVDQRHDACDDEPVGDALREVRSRREELRWLMVELERAAAAPSGRRFQAWQAKLQEVLHRLKVAFDEHAALNEEPGGLFEQVLDHQPRLAHLVDRLEHEHLTIAHVLSLLVDRASVASSLDEEGDVAELREGVLQLLGHLARHRHLGSELLYEAYSVDTGTGD